MKMTPLALVALAFLLCAHQLQAALGDTQTDLVKRYGKIQSNPSSLTPKDVTIQFKSGGYTITVTLLSGQSGREIYTRDDGKGFSDAELQVLLEASKLGSKWQLVRNSDVIGVWVLDSRDGFAAYDKLRATFTVKTSDMLAFEEALVKVQEQQQAAAKAHPTPDPSLRP